MSDSDPNDLRVTVNPDETGPWQGASSPDLVADDAPTVISNRNPLRAGRDGSPASDGSESGLGVEITTGSGPGSSSRRERGKLLGVPELGSRVAEFLIHESIGVGGMGAVFRAEDTRLGRDVALKVLPLEQAAEPEVVQRFYQEGRAAARLDHENIARVYAIGHDGAYHYIVFEFIAGTNLRQKVDAHGPLSVEESINYTLQIADALVHASGRGVVHRDIKPSNIIVAAQSRAKLVDMGLARHFERGRDDGLTQSGMTLGTFDYISPEQARDPRNVDVRSDLYSLGCTLYHMLTGHPPFPDGTVLQKLIQHQEELPRDVREINPDVPDELATILVKLMAKDRDRRYQTPEQLVRDLLTLAGMLRLRSISPEGLVWMEPAAPSAWERHLIWGVPALALTAVVAALVWMGRDNFANSSAEAGGSGPIAPLASSPSDAAPGSKVILPTGPGSVVGPDPVAVRPPVEPEPDRTATKAAPTVPAAEPAEVRLQAGDDLRTILASARRPTRIVLTDEGPYRLSASADDFAEPLKFDGARISIRAESSTRPVVRLEAGPFPGPLAPPALELHGGRLELEGLDMVVVPPDFGTVSSGSVAGWSAIRVTDGDVRATGCKLTVEAGTLDLGRVPLAALETVVSATEPGSSSRTRFGGCEFGPGLIAFRTQGPTVLAARDCTLRALGQTPAVRAENDSTVPAEFDLDHLSILGDDGAVFRLAGTAPAIRLADSVIAPTRPGGSFVLATASEPERLDWLGSRNLYGAVGIYLESLGDRPTTRFRPIEDFETWASTVGATRSDSGTLAGLGRVWSSSDPLADVRQGRPREAYRLAASTGNRLGALGGHVPGARAIPSGTIPPPTVSPSSGLIARAPGSSSPTSQPPPVEIASVPPTRTLPPTVGSEPGPSTSLPMPMPAAPDRNAAETGTGEEPDPEVMAPMTPMTPTARIMPEPEGPADEGPKGAGEARSDVVRTAEEFRDARARLAGRGGTIRLAADAEIVLDACELAGRLGWKVLAEAGARRPKIVFRPARNVDPGEMTTPSALFTLTEGSLELEGIDVVLPAPTASTSRARTVIRAGAGADVSLRHCSFTLEGRRSVSSALEVAGESVSRPGGMPVIREEIEAPRPVVLRITESLLRGGGDIVRVEASGRVDAELTNVVVFCGGSLLHAEGSSRPREADVFRAEEQSRTIKLGLRRTSVLTAGGLVRLSSTPDAPELPIADVTARDSIFAAADEAEPLLRIDGQDSLDEIQNRIRWEAVGVAYHHVETYRRDQTTLTGILPKRYDKPSWTVAVGPHEQALTYGDLAFRQQWPAGRPLWDYRAEDLMLEPESPAATAGADVSALPVPGLGRGEATPANAPGRE